MRSSTSVPSRRAPARHDSVHIARLRAAGAIPIGMTSCSEFGTVHFTDTKAWGTTRNPWNLDLTPGGSSGGSSAVVAAGVVPFTMLANICWNPAISIPAGLTRAGLPVGLQVTTRRHADELVLRLARISEQQNPWPRTAPGWF